MRNVSPNAQWNAPETARMPWAPWLLLMSLFQLSQAGTALGACYKEYKADIDWSGIPRSVIDQIPFRKTEKSDLSHPAEERGFVDVPVDYDRPDGPRLQIFYRLLPAGSGSASKRDKPVLVIMNGGPGVPSSAYRTLDFEYGGREIDSLSELAIHFRLVLVDQRGTGKSSPLNLDDPSLSVQVIARFFDSDEHALDHGEVIQKIVPPGEPFFILARSYGGEIGFKYLLFGNRVRQPAGMVFSSAILPHTDAMRSFLARREKQLELNHQLRSKIPASVAKLNRLRQRAKALGLDPGTVNFLWADLGGPPGWEEKLDAGLDQLLGLDEPDELRSALGGSIAQSVNLLNYVLSSASLTPGFTDRTITRETSKRVPFEPWMLDENWTLNQLGRDGSWRECFIEAIDRNPPPSTRFPPIAVIRQALSLQPVLFTFGSQDAFVPGELQLERARKLSDPGQTKYVMLEGGHASAFEAEGAQTVADWATKVLSWKKEESSNETKIERN